MNDFKSMASDITCIHLPEGACNDLSCSTLDFSRFDLLEELIIGDDSFCFIDSFIINGLSHLKSLKIGRNSFTKRKSDWGNDPSRSFHILNCDELESITIGEYSFSDYGGLFELKNLPKLESIDIGKVEMYSWSANFYCSSFVVESITLYI